jgi:hypothetical protein
MPSKPRERQAARRHRLRIAEAARIDITIPKELHRKLKRKAADQGITLTDYIVDRLEKGTK